MSENIKTLSELERFEIININDGEKYLFSANNDIILDKDGKLKYLILSASNSKFAFFGSDEFLEIPWEYVRKVGANTIILDADDSVIKRARL